MSVTDPIRDEHKGLLPKIEKLREVARSASTKGEQNLVIKLDENLKFLRHHLVPHAEAEDKVMYHEVGRIMGSPLATQTMSRDHVAVIQLTEKLAKLRESMDDLESIKETLYGLYALISVHFQKEEEIYLPLLDESLSQSEADEMFRHMGHSAHNH